MLRSTMRSTPMPQSATIESLPAAFRIMKAMQAEGVEWGEDYRTAARAALKEVLETRMGDLPAYAEPVRLRLPVSRCPRSTPGDGPRSCGATTGQPVLALRLRTDQTGTSINCRSRLKRVPVSAGRDN